MQLKKFKVKYNWKTFVFLLLIILFNFSFLLSADDVLERENLKKSMEFLTKGNFYLLQKDYDKALKYFLDGFKLYSKSKELANNIGIVYRKKGNWRKAIQFYRLSINLDPTYIPPRVNLCLLYYDKGNLVEIKKQADELLKYRPDSGLAYFAKGFVAYKRHYYNEAVKFLRKSLKLAKENDEYVEDAKVLLRKARTKATYSYLGGGR